MKTRLGDPYPLHPTAPARPVCARCGTEVRARPPGYNRTCYWDGWHVVVPVARTAYVPLGARARAWARRVWRRVTGPFGYCGKCGRRLSIYAWEASRYVYSGPRRCTTCRH